MAPEEARQLASAYQSLLISKNGEVKGSTPRVPAALLAKFR